MLEVLSKGDNRVEKYGEIGTTAYLFNGIEVGGIQMIYVIFGMHKSGTTLVAEMLHKSGINMGDFDESVSYDIGNQYERNE